MAGFGAVLESLKGIIFHSVAQLFVHCLAVDGGTDAMYGSWGCFSFLSLVKPFSFGCVICFVRSSALYCHLVIARCGSFYLKLVTTCVTDDNL